MIAGHILSLRPVELLARLALVHLASLVLDLETFLESATSGDPRRSSRRTDPPTDPPGEADSAEDNPPPGDGHPDPSSGG